MRNFEHITFHTDNEIGYITLNRPDKHNPISDIMMDEITELCETVAKLTDIRVVILKANGKNFCAGADLNWMRQQAQQPFKDNKADALKLGRFFYALSTLPQPLIAMIQGKVYAGGLGLIACCDFAISEIDSVFCFSEVKLGLIPATITPYVIRKIGYTQTKALILSAEIFDADTAKNIGLLYRTTDKDSLESTTLALAEQLKLNGPQALAQTKKLIDDFYPIESQMHEYTAELLAHIRAGDEAQSRIKEFLGE